MLTQDTVFVDIETTGGNAVRDRITEVAIITVSEGQIVSEWSTLINPLVRIPENIQRLTGISNDMVMDLPSFHDIYKEILEKLHGNVFVAHNARFDYGFLKNEFKRCDISFKSPVLCTVKLSRNLFPEYKRHNLDSIMQRHGLTCRARHRAMGDARVLYDFMQVLYSQFDSNDVEEVIQRLLKRPSLPPGLIEDDIMGLPEGPGVYLFYDKHHIPIYIGKSINIHDRVLSHFSSDHQSAKEMKISQNIASIEYIETAGELGALIEESRLIKKLLPTYNRRLRRYNSLATIKWDGTHKPEIITADLLDPCTIEKHFGLFKSNKKAKDTLLNLAKDHQLCLKSLGLEKGKGPCFAFQLNKCYGVCAGKESQEKHDLRTAIAFQPLKNKSWPYPGKIGIREYSKYNRRTDIHIFNQWCYLGVAHNDPELRQLSLFQDQEIPFDLDTYKILIQYLKKHPDLEIIDI